MNIRLPSLLLILTLVVGCGAAPVATNEGAQEGRAEVVVSTPAAGSILVSPVLVSGFAPGTWFFEAQLPVELLDEDGQLLARGSATADGEWMTEEPVSFQTELSFSDPKGKAGTLVIRKDNPSGEPENNMEVRIPVRF